MAKADLTAQRLRELLHYDPETGMFTRQVDVFTGRSGKNVIAKKGDVAGCVCKRKTCRYRIIWIDSRQYYAHRLAWFYVHGHWPAGIIDHINGDGLDNRIGNLRDVSQYENMQNLRRARSGTYSGLMGASFDKSVNKWRSGIRVNGKQHDLGLHATAEAAHAAYIAAKRRLHKDYCTI